MQITKVDAHATTTHKALDKELLNTAPYAWFDVRADGPDDPDLKKLIAQVDFPDALASYTGRANASGTFQIVGSSVMGATWAADDDGATVLVYFIWNTARLVTIRFGADSAMDKVLAHVKQGRGSLFANPTIVPGVVLELIMASINRLLTRMSDQLEDLDARIIESVQPSQLNELRVLRSQLTPLSRRLPTYLDNLNEALVDPTMLPGMDAAGIQHLQSYRSYVQDTISRLGDVTDGIRDAAQDHQNEVSNNQGNRINQLTIVSMIFLPATFITGYFGMNFQWLVNQTMSFGTWLALGVILPILIFVLSIRALSRHGYKIRLHSPRHHSATPSRADASDTTRSQATTANPRPPAS